MTDADGLSILGSTVRAPVQQLECFPTPDPSVRRVRFTTDEVTSMCPVTGQPDFSSVEIDYEPAALCVESKSLKLYLWSFHDQPIFAEGLAAVIAAEVKRAALPVSVRVTVTQHVRGGIVTEAAAPVTTAARCVAVVSGGLDSAVLAHHLLTDGWELRLVSYDYGQRHAVELDHARRLADHLGVRHDVVDLRSVGALLTGSALTDDSVEVPDGHYSDDSMRSTVVANRNAIFAMVATGVAVADGAAAIGLGIHAGDHAIYPDCRPPFVEAAEHLARIANEGFVLDTFQVLAPFVAWTKADIVRRGDELGVPFALTWSCYRGGEVHCGTCGTCVERKEAFADAGVDDPTEYEVS